MKFIVTGNPFTQKFFVEFIEKASLSVKNQIADIKKPGYPRFFNLTESVSIRSNYAIALMRAFKRLLLRAALFFSMMPLRAIPSKLD